MTLELPLPQAPLRIAAAQACAVPGDLNANATVAAGLFIKAAADGADLVVFPELTVTGYELELIASDPDRHSVIDGDAPCLRPVREACRMTGTAAVVGAAVRDGEQLFISALVFGRDGRFVGRYDKQHLYAGEDAVFSPGRGGGCTFVLDGWRVGLGICYDSGFPEHARSAALDGCHVYAVGALFGVGGGEHQYKTWFPARALDNTSYVLLANHVGRAGQWRACGGSAVWSPDGRLIAEASPVDPGVVVVGLDPAVLKTVRGDLSMLADLTRSSSVPRRTELKN